ncbi:MAG: hypothetical protein GX207_07250 [Peptococcaceae bacterium]|nr:hypothetical protein [Peptococcaceae bacterium]
MKKSNLYIGLIYLFIGIACLIIALNFESRLEGLLYGFSGAGICGGSVILWKYYYWTRPKNKDRYKEKIENESIELHDERKIILRDKSGRYAYIVGLIVISVSIVVFFIIGSLNIIENTKLIIVYLAGFLAFQYIIGIIFFNYLNKKY